MPDKALLDRRHTVPFLCLPHLLEHHAKRIPDALAILAPGRIPLTYGHLYQHIEQTRHRLRAMGIGRHDRIVVALPNGPEVAVAILAVATSAVCAPLNPAFQADELERYFADLRPRALISQAGIDTPARRVALSRAVRVIELSPALDAEAGLFTLIGRREHAPAEKSARPNDVAVLLLTSGTTARPKIVPQTQANICTSAYSSAAVWALSESDRCVNMLPLFHGHGLHNTLMASLAAGASVVCTRGWDVNNFFGWVTAFRPTWFSAVPTIHQAILAEARQNRERIRTCRLRFVRSGSAPLKNHVLEELESVFEAPVIEYYAMTETTSTPIACNPLPPGRRKAGSAGLPASLDVAVMHEGGDIVGARQTGEIAVRGPGVMPGYDGDPIATRAAFAGDWLKTGDLGFFDEDGYLFLVGRSRETINRGGEKITPGEIDEVLLEHPAVAEAATFPAPHPTLGEDVATAIVLRPRAKVTAKEIRQFATARLADFKIPRQILFVKEVPKGPTGKLQRFMLAEKLGLASNVSAPHASVTPRTSVQKVFAGLWAELLGLDHVGIDDDFFVSGGDSLLAAQLLARTYETFRIEIDVSRFFEGPTVAEIARHIEELKHASHAPLRPPTIVHVPRENGVAPASIAQERFWNLQRALPNLPFFNILYALRLTPSLDPAVLERSINEIVRRHETLRTALTVVDGQCVQIIAPHLIVPLAVDDLRALRRSEKETFTDKIVQEEVVRAFNLEKAPLIRARLLRLTRRKQLLLISTHQVICDGWSLGVFIEELVTLHDAFSAQQEPTLAPLAIQYADFAHWQRHWRSHLEIVAQLAYWREQLRGPLPSMRLAASPAKRPISNLRTARRAWALPASLAEAAKDLGHQEGGTLFMALVAALKILLHHYLGQDDIRVATNVANRNRPGTERLIGPVVNTVILRTNLAGDPSAREVMRRVRATTLAAFANQDLPIEHLAEILDRERKLEPAELSNIMILLQNTTLRPLRGAASKLIFEEASANMLMPLVTITTFDIIIMLREGSDGLMGTCAYKPHLFAAKTIDRLLCHYRQVLELVVARPERPVSAIHLVQ